MKTKFFSLFVALVAAIGTMFANGAKVGSLWYIIDTENKTATVTYSRASAVESENGYIGNITVPKTIKYQKEDYDVIAIGDSAFYRCFTLKTVKLPNSIKKINNSAFQVCRNMTSINIPESVEEIGARAFSTDCSLMELNVPTTITVIGDKAFYLVPNIIYEGSDANAPWGARTTNGVVDGLFVFDDDTKTTLSACSYAASGTIEIPESVTIIDKYAFACCINLDSLKVPSTVKSLNSQAFYDCASLISLYIPSEIEFIADNAFDYVPNVIYKGSLTQAANWGAKTLNGFVDNHFVYKDDTKEKLTAISCKVKGDIIIPNYVKTIGSYALYVGPETGITSLTLGNSVKEIESGAFYNCRLMKSIVLPSSLKSFGKFVFDYCDVLETIICNASTPPAFSYSNPFSYASEDLKIYVPAVAIDAYGEDPQWGEYHDKIFPITADHTVIASDKVFVTAADYSATIKWPIETTATVYTVQVTEDDVLKFNYRFNDKGELQSNAFGAPGMQRNGEILRATQASKAWQFEINGLEPETSYIVTVLAENDEGELYKKSTEFKTTKVQAIDNVAVEKSTNIKLFKDGQLLIKRGDKMYNAAGQVVE